MGPDDKQAIADCFSRFAGPTHGMMFKTEREMRSLFRGQENQIVGVELDGELRGYLVYTFEQGDDFITNDMHIQEWIYETPEALSDLLTFLHTQHDQIRRVTVDTHERLPPPLARPAGRLRQPHPQRLASEQRPGRGLDVPGHRRAWHL